MEKQLEELGKKLKDYYQSIEENMWDFEQKSIKILETAIQVLDFPEDLREGIIKYISLECPIRPESYEYVEGVDDEIYDRDCADYEKDLERYDKNMKKAEDLFERYGFDFTEVSKMHHSESDSFEILTRDLKTKFLKDVKHLKELQQPKTIESQKIINMKKDENQSVLQVGDPISYKNDEITYIGKIDAIDQKTGDYTLRVYNSKETKELQLDKSSKLDSLFFITKEGQKIHTKFTYEETLKAIKASSEIKLKDFADQIISLRLGNKTGVINYDKKIDDTMVGIAGRLELRRDMNGNPYLKDNPKHQKLNLDLPIYGLKLNEEQKEKLLKTGELGLVSGFKSNDNEFNLWVSLDKELNKIVSKRESDININKIYGVTTTDEQREKLKAGENVIVNIKNKNYLFQASAATTKSDGFKSISEEKAKELKLISDQKNQESKKNRDIKV